ncbi:MAG: hypothetical protein HYV63_00195 [Candidatus Schekmanbacteria bacterium]|nr:hypothetical protein [Candidatus Schekmanbacteria bacterium]
MPVTVTLSGLVEGSYQWQARAADAFGLGSAWEAFGGNAAGDVDFAIDLTAPPRTALAAPANGSATSDPTPALRCAANADAGGILLYEVAVAATADFAAVIAGGGATEPELTVSAALADGTYYWRARALDVAGNAGAWSEAWTFTVDTAPPAPVSLAAPADGAILATGQPTLVWSVGEAPGGVGLYEVQIAGETTETGEEQLTPGTPLADGAYSWRVRWRNGARQWAEWSATRGFTVDTVPPARVALLVPAPGTRLTTERPTFAWRAEKATQAQPPEPPLAGGSRSSPPPQKAGGGSGSTAPSPSARQCPPPPPIPCDPDGPGRDHPDDRVDAAALVAAARTVSGAGGPAVAVLDAGTARGMLEVLADRFLVARVAPGIAASEVPAPVLVVPSGALAQVGSSPAVVTMPQSYVDAGGTLVAMAQQRGADLAYLPVPAGSAPLEGLGWAEDQSCFSAAAEVGEWHPVLASIAANPVDIALDGYFVHVPASTTVLLRRATTGAPAVIAYPVGQGWVVANTTFADWGAGYGLTTALERDLLAATARIDLVAGEVVKIAPGAAGAVAIAVTNASETDAVAADVVLIAPGGTLQELSHVGLELPAGGTVTLTADVPAAAEVGV